MGSQARTDGLCAGFVGVVALAVRVGGFTDHGVSRDDAWVALAHRASVGDAVRFGITIPGFELFMKFWAGITDATAWLQLPELIASVAAVVVAYFVARHLRCSPAAAMVAGGILAVAPISVVFATRVKPYSFDLLDSLLILFLAVRVIDRPTTRRAISLAVVSLLAVALSASVLPVAAVAVAWAAWRTRATTRIPIVVAGAYAAVVAVYATVVLASVPPPLHAFWKDKYITDVSSAIDTFKLFTAGAFPLHGPSWIGLVVLAVIGVGVIWARRDLAPMLLVPIAVGAALAIAKRAPFGGGRTDLYLYPCLAIAAALTVQKLSSRLPSPTTVVAVILLVVALVDGRRELDRNPYPSSDLAKLADAINDERLPGDAVVVAPFSRYGYALAMEPAPEFVISSNYSTRFTVVSRDPNVFLMPAEFYEGGYDVRAAALFADGRARVWYVATDTPESDTPTDVQANEYEPERLLIAKGYVVLQRIDVRGAHADLLVLSGGPA